MKSFTSNVRTATILAGLVCVSTASAGDPESITVEIPDAGTVLFHGQSPIGAQYTPDAIGNVRADLYKGGILVGEYHQLTVDDGSFFRAFCPPEWGTGSDFRVRIERPSTGDFGWSDEFTIADGGVIVVTQPNSETVMTHGDTDQPVNWMSPQVYEDLVNTVYCEVYKDGLLVDTGFTSTTNNGSSMIGLVPETWAPGTDYRVRIVHDNGWNWGWSEEFTVACSPIDILGDANGDGLVDFEDLNLVLSFWGQNVDPYLDGDLTGDGFVGFDDLNTVLGAWGDSC